MTTKQYRELSLWLVIKTRKRLIPWRLGISSDNRLQVQTDEFGLRTDQVITDLPWSITVEEAKALITPKLKETQLAAARQRTTDNGPNVNGR